jgi:uncharacterized protein YukE
MSGTLTRPSGDPQAVAAAAASIGQIGADLSSQLGAFRTTASQVVQSWRGPRAAVFAEAVGSATKRLTATAEQLTRASVVLQQYVAVLASAQAAVDDLNQRWPADAPLSSLISSPAGAGSPGWASDSLQAELQQQTRREQAALAEQAAEVQREVDLAARRAAAALDEATVIGVPGGTALSPDAIFRQVLKSSGEGLALVGMGYMTFKQDTDWLFSSKGLWDGRRQWNAALHAVRRWNDARAADLLLDQTRSMEDAKVLSAQMTINPNDYRLLRAWMRRQEAVSAAKGTSIAAKSAAARAAEDLVESVKLGTKFAKVCGVLGMVSGAVDIVHPEHHDWRRTGDQVAGIMSIGGGTASLLLTAGLLNPVLAPVVAGALVVAAAWTVGNFVYDHWDDIEHGLDTAKDFVVDQAKKDWHEAEHVAHEVAGGARKVGGKIASGVRGLIS